MPVHLHALRGVLPETAYAQTRIRDVIRAQPELDRLGQRLTTSIFDHSGIDTRHSVVPDFADGAPAGLFYDPATGGMRRPTTGQRNAYYIEHATPLFVAAARAALEASPQFGAADVTHVITVSCTGFYAPGPDYAIVRALGLSPHTQRFHVGFMGCYAAFPALRMARAFCAADPDAVVLVVCAELCTVHMHSAGDPDTLIANSVFADGAAGVVVSARPPMPGTPALRVDALHSTLTPEGVGEHDMAWTIGDQGYDMVLSTYVPEIIEANLCPVLDDLLAGMPGVQRWADVERWAIHPGGRQILDRVQTSAGLSDGQLAPSRDVLRRAGNMSSATVLFILQDVLTSAAPGDRVAALAFGPGLTVESGVFTVCGGPP
ncbi:putative naringenin-chalcone synthase [Deinococcus metalli]|uniref:Naringenin-chalcone synthase n=1 Tax=Deinococcus metalli TaxID=1141878 RepID=A0A7W8KDR0_9DEIO|nr:3-oxoacyl-[acyl-carrier-protein] synthase III C-terminal domain-containing protein [Deinococcus metalli]MBB5375853.1 putative naringenin-chalcone synthase [Deinococcus metalli]GHF36542.1 naringenin-chalcone synthase [Deinococcus metalli]